MLLTLYGLKISLSTVINDLSTQFKPALTDFGPLGVAESSSKHNTDILSPIQLIWQSS